MEVHRVLDVRGELPDLGCVQSGAGIHVLRVEHFTVDAPYYLAFVPGPSEVEIAVEIARENDSDSSGASNSPMSESHNSIDWAKGEPARRLDYERQNCPLRKTRR
jgi:hypothetical protein